MSEPITPPNCDRLKEAVELYEAQKLDVAVRIADLEKRVIDLHTMIRFAISGPGFNTCRLVLLDTLHGCTGAGNVDEVRRKPEHAADARRLGIAVSAEARS